MMNTAVGFDSSLSESCGRPSPHLVVITTDAEHAARTTYPHPRAPTQPSERRVCLRTPPA